MRTRAQKYSDVENVGLIDSVFRSSLGIAILLSMLFIPTVSSAQLIVLTLVAVYAGLTGVISWDPFYALMKRSRRQMHEPVEQVVSLDIGKRRQSDEVSHKKAA